DLLSSTAYIVAVSRITAHWDTDPRPLRTRGTIEIHIPQRHVATSKQRSRPPDCRLCFLGIPSRGSACDRSNKNGLFREAPGSLALSQNLMKLSEKRLSC